MKKTFVTFESTVNYQICFETVEKTEYTPEFLVFRPESLLEL